MKSKMNIVLFLSFFSFMGKAAECSLGPVDEKTMFLEVYKDKQIVNYQMPADPQKKRYRIQYNIVYSSSIDSTTVIELFDSAKMSLPYISAAAEAQGSTEFSGKNAQEFLKKSYSKEARYWIEFKFEGEDITYCSPSVGYSDLEPS
jgi:hypothetical protein